jgi:hypothetical protein
LKMFSGEARGLYIAVLIACSLGAAGCTGTPGGAGEVSPAPEHSVTTPLVSAPVASTAHDGSSVLPSAEVSVCNVLELDRIREILGAAASTIQPGESAGSVDAAGIRRESCIYPLDDGGTTTHAVVVEVTTYESADALAAANPFSAMADSIEVSGLSGPARFSVVELSGSTEYILAIARESKITRLIVAQPKSSPWNSVEGRDALKQLAISHNI